MEVLNVELGPQDGLGLGPQLGDLELTDLVGCSLARPCHIPVNL